MTTDKVFKNILDNAFNKFKTDDYSISDTAFIESVIDFFSDGCGEDLHSMYLDYKYDCNKYLTTLDLGI